MKAIFKAIPYAFVLIYALTQSQFQRLNAALIAAGPRQPNEQTGEVWEIAYRGGAHRYATLQDYVIYYAPFVMVPAFIAAVIWILIDLWKAGLFGLDRR